MRACAQYAITYPKREKAVIDELDLTAMSRLTFFEPDTKTFALLDVAKDSIAKGGALPAVLNAANEVSVAKFLEGKIGFYAITQAVCEVVAQMQYAKDKHTLDEIILCDREAREMAEKILA